MRRLREPPLPPVNPFAGTERMPEQATRQNDRRDDKPARRPRVDRRAVNPVNAAATQVFKPPPSQQIDRHSATPTPDVVHLAEPPSIGRVARSWQRHIASDDWPRPSLVADYGLIGTCVLAAASVTGRTHAHRSQARQDAYGFKERSPSLLCAIADGVSDARFGGPGADVAISAALAAVEGVSTGHLASLDTLKAAVERANDAVDALARDFLPGDVLAAHQCATTLVLAEVSLLAGGQMHVRIASVGDSSALTIGPDGTLGLILGPEVTEETQALRNYLPQLGVKIERAELTMPAGSILLLATDGLAADMHRSAAVRDWVVGQIRLAESPVGAAHVLSYARQGSGDDLTFVAVRPAALK